MNGEGTMREEVYLTKKSEQELKMGRIDSNHRHTGRL